MFCPQCGKALPSKTDKFCTFCGRNLNTVPPQTKANIEPAVQAPPANKPRLKITNPRPVMVISQKNTGTAALIGFFGGLFGLQGLGQIYAGRAGRGLLILAASITLYVFAWMSILGGILGGFTGALSGSTAAGNAMFSGVTLATVLVLAYAGLFIWQILDARACAQKYNERLEARIFADESDSGTDTEAA